MNNLTDKQLIFRIPISTNTEQEIEKNINIIDQINILPLTSSEDIHIKKFFRVLINIVGIERFRQVIEIGLGIYINKLMK